MSNQQPKNQLSFVRETLEIISKHSEGNESLGYDKIVFEILRDRYHTQKIPILDYLANIQKYREKNQSKIALDPYTQIYLCIKIVQDHIIYFEVNQIDEYDIIKDLNKIIDLFKSILNEGLYRFFVSYHYFYRVEKEFINQEKNPRFSMQLELIDSYISILKKIESRYPKYEITEDELIQYKESINELINNIKNSNLRENIKSKIITNLLQIKEIIDNIYAFSREDIEKQIIYNSYLWTQLDENEALIKENKPRFVKFVIDFMTNIVSKIQDPEFISENIIRAALSLEVGETLKKLPEFIYKMLPPN